MSFRHIVECLLFQLETCLEIANIQLSPDELDVMLQCIVDDDGTVLYGVLYHECLYNAARATSRYSSAFFVLPFHCNSNLFSVLFRRPC
jgi:hypothetical protein